MEDLDGLKAALADRYRIEREIGAGGMATVYLATDLRHDRKVAVKILRPDLAASLGAERFLQEVRVTANLTHPHILPLHDSGEANGFLFYVMPYIEGESLRERLVREHELPVPEAARLLRDVVDALAAAHKLGVVHRDIKPENVLISGRHAMVADFGVAKAVSEATGRHKLTTVGVALGTPSYMAPEQAAADETIDHRADIYAVGVMAYELLAGRPPFSGSTPQQVLAAQVMDTPQPLSESRPSVPPALEALVMRCLEKRPADRWQSAEEMLPHLEAAATPSGGVTPTDIQPVRRHALWPWAVTGSAVVVVGLAGWWLLGGRGGGAATDRAGEVAPGFVVVPFENQSSVDSLDALGGIMADYLTSQVSRNGIGWVVPSTAVRDLVRERPDGSDAISYFSDATGARYVVTGSFFLQGEALVMQAEVTDAANSELLTTVGPLQGPDTEFMELAASGTDRILPVLARLIDPHPGVAAAPVGIAGQPRSLAAYRDFTEAMGLFGQGENLLARELFYRALATDSTYAEALIWAAVVEWRFDIARADSLVQIAERYRPELSPWDLRTLDWMQGWIQGDRDAVWRAGLRQAELDPVGGGDIAAARHTNHLRHAVEWARMQYDRLADQPALVGVFWLDLLTSLHLLGEHETELEYARDVRARFPDDWRTLGYEIRALAALGRLDEVRALISDVDVLATESGWSVSEILSQACYDLRPHGHTELAAELAERAVEWCESHGERTAACARALYQSGDMEGARTLFKEMVDADPDDQTSIGWLGSAAAVQGDRQTALAMSQRLAEIEARPYHYGAATGWRAAIAAELGELDEAVALLQEAYRQGLAYGMFLRHREQYRSLQGYPPFERFLRPKG